MTVALVSDLLVTHRAQFDALARAWLACGAASFSVSDSAGAHLDWQSDAQGDGIGIAREPPEGPKSVPICAPIYRAGQKIGELRVNMPADTAAQERAAQERAAQVRLQADAACIEQIAGLEFEMDSLAAELVTNQDQLLALYNLSQAHRGQQTTQTLADSRAMLSTLVCEVARLTRSQCMCYVQLPDADPWIEAYPHPFLDVARVGALLRRADSRTQVLLLGGADVPHELQDHFGNLLIIPMRVHGAEMAGMLLGTQPDVRIASPDMKLARTISEQVGAQIENALLYHELLEQTRLHTEMELAREMQTRLFPQHFPGVPGFEVAAGAKPALQVGGDFYDLIYKPGKPFIFSVGDATGKGLSAALIMAMSHTVLRSAANFMPLPLPANLLRRVNENLYSDLTDLGIFVTAFTGYFIPGKHELVYANAGHSPVIYKPAHGPARMLEADGPPIGVLSESLSENQKLPFHCGDILVVATDGFSEAHNSQEELLGYDRLVAHVEQVAQQSATEIAASFFQLAEQFAAGHLQDDDQTLVIIKGAKE